jgi:hypothetical protein
MRCQRILHNRLFFIKIKMSAKEDSQECQSLSD